MHVIDFIMSVLALVPIIAFFFIVNFYIYLKLSVAKKFEKIFNYIHNKETFSFYGHKEGRFDDYIELIVSYDYHKKNDTSLYQTFNGYNFREHITRRQYLIVKAYRWAIFIAGTSLLIWAVLMLLIYHTLDA